MATPPPQVFRDLLVPVRKAAAHPMAHGLLLGITANAVWDYRWQIAELLERLWTCPVPVSFGPLAVLIVSSVLAGAYVNDRHRARD